MIILLLLHCGNQEILLLSAHSQFWDISVDLIFLYNIFCTPLLFKVLVYCSLYFLVYIHFYPFLCCLFSQFFLF